MNDEIMRLLERMDTKLTLVCGEHGDGGLLARHDERIDRLEAEHERRQGAIWALGTVWSIVIGLIEYLIHRK